MKQGNLETLVVSSSAYSGERKIACETLAEPQDYLEKTDQIPPDHHHRHPEEEQEIPPDFPPESFWLSKDAEFDWFDRNAFYERKDSQKGNSAPNSTNLNPNLNRNGNSSSQRRKSTKPSIFGLPTKPQQSCFVDAKNRKHCKAESTRLFPKRSGSYSKSGVALVEPSSPKVSCIGRVRSKKSRSRRLRNRQNSVKLEKVKKEKKAEKPKPSPPLEKTAEKRRSGFFSSFRSIFRSHGKSRETHAPPVETSEIFPRFPPVDSDEISIESPPSPPRRSVETVSLGGMKRFSSGRRFESLI